jgi:ATP-dependent DNA ligase
VPIADQRVLNSRTHDGFVLKDDRMYGQWFKEKPRLTMDLVVTGGRWGKGMHSGRIGSLELADRNGQFVCYAAAMDLPMRIALTEMWTSGSLIGRVVEVAYERVGSRGGLQHPRFIALRDDKEIKDADCIA